MENNILLTGATGFVGKHLIPYLERNGKNVLPIQRAELQNLSLISNQDAIVHLAGKAHDLKKTSDPSEYYEVNFELTKKLYNAFLKSSAKKFIFISSVKAAADTVEGILTEDQSPNPQTDYGKSKLMAETYIQNQPLPTGKSYYIIRPCMIHGPGNKGNLNLLYQFVKRNIPYPLGAFHNKRSFLSIANLCFAIERLISKEVPSGIYQIADDEALSTNQVIKILAEATQQQPKLWAFPVSIINLVAKIGDYIKLPLNTERLKKLTESYVVSNQKIKMALDSELPLSVYEGLKITASAFKSSPTN